jgi:hypothetical protein
VLNVATSLGGVLLAANLALLGPMPDELIERIRGQVSDLAWELTLIPLDQNQRQRPWLVLKTQSSTATFDLAVWVETSSDATDRLSMYDPRSGQLRVKSLPQGQESRRRQRSANYEMLALLLRSQIKAYQMRPVVAPKPKPPAKETIRALDPPPPPPAAHRWVLFFDANHRLDGLKTVGGSMLALDLGLQSENWIGFLGLQTAWPQVQTDPYSTLKLSQHEARMGADWIGYAGEFWSVSMRGLLGLDLYTAELTKAQGIRLMTDVPPVWAGRSGLGLSFTLFPGGPNARIGFRASFAAHAVWGVPEYRYATPSGTKLRNELWFVQPQMGLGLVFRQKGARP